MRVLSQRHHFRYPHYSPCFIAADRHYNRDQMRWIEEAGTILLPDRLGW